MRREKRAVNRQPLTDGCGNPAASGAPRNPRSRKKRRTHARPSCRIIATSRSEASRSFAGSPENRYVPRCFPSPPCVAMAHVRSVRCSRQGMAAACAGMPPDP